MEERVDILILGSGIAGLTAALELAKERRVLILSKGARDESNTTRAQGGIASVLSGEDSFQEHVQDTLDAGGGLCEEDRVRLCVEGGPESIHWLESLGVHFANLSGKNGYDLGREGGHSRRRVAHAKDLTGRVVEDVLLEAVEANPNIEIREHHLGVDLITTRRIGHQTPADQCIGAYVMDKLTGTISTIEASATILATGGAGKVYLYTSNPDVATGDGLAMAWRAGASVSNMEFFQFHPTCLYHPQSKNFLISEAVRGEGGVLLTQGGERFMPAYTPQAELAPRDIVARAIDDQLKKTGDDFVLLDISHKPPGFVENRFPQIFEACLKLGMDIRNEPIPVVPAAHYQCGGVQVNEHGWTGIPGLYAIGEVACTGMHGANRLASNSLLEALVFGKRAAHNALKWLRELPEVQVPAPAWHTGFARHPDESVVISQNWDELRRFMWNYVGVVRSDNRMIRARKRLQMLREEVLSDYWSFILTPDLIELRNLTDVAHLILEMALMRKESRGLHYNLDYPGLDDAHWKRPIILKRPAQWRREGPRSF